MVTVPLIVDLGARNLEFLKEIVGKIWKVLVDAERYAQELFPELKTNRVPSCPIS